MIPSLLFALSLTIAGNPIRTPGPTRILIGTPPAPVVSGEVWLIANRWGAYPGVLVATIHNGELETRQGIRFPRYWEQAFNYKILVALSNQQVSLPKSSYQDFAYQVSGRPEYLKNFPIIYISPALPAKNLGRDWEKALQEIGHAAGNVLALPSPQQRTIRLEYPDGRPFVGTEVYVSLFGSRRNHCGVPVGIELGGFKTNPEGEISFVATNSSLAINKSYFKKEAGGPTGTMFKQISDVLVGTEQHITVQILWTLPKYDYVIRLRTKKDYPVVHAHLTACDNFDGCGTGCGPLAPGKASNESGTIRFRDNDLRELRSITAVDTAGEKRNLTTQEMRRLLTRHRLQLIW